MPHEELELKHWKSHLHASVYLLLEVVVGLGGFVLDHLVILRFDSFGYHVGIVIVVKDAIPYDMGWRVYVLYNEAASTISGLDLGLRDGVGLFVRNVKTG